MNHVRTVLACIAAAVTSLVVWIALPYIIWLLGILMMLLVSLSAGAAAYYAVKHADIVAQHATNAFNFVRSLRSLNNSVEV